MDFWSRLLGSSRLAEGKTAPLNSQQRLQRFRRHYEQIRNTYEKTPLLQSDTAAASAISTNLQRLTTILQDESRSPQPHPCLSFVDSANIYQSISRIGAVAQNEAVIRDAVAFFVALVDADEEEFVANRRFARALMTFVDRTSDSANLYVGEDTEAEIVELLFGIAAKIRLEPRYLNVWFAMRARTKGERKGDGNAFVGVTSKEDFPLCYQLIDHVHHEGRIGDFARTGLLYVFETASRSGALENWIVESDLPTLMASGLGALYSQLSRKLSILHPREKLPVILQLSDYLDLEPPVEAEIFYSEYLQGHLETFLSYLTFWQDVLEHCTSVEVKQSLLDHFQILFLQQLLYPSLLESSDIDGGSSVAVLTYVRRIVESLEHVDFVHLILQYLLALPQSVGMESSVVSLSRYAANKRKSLLLLAKTSNNDDEASPDLFNLADLVQSSIRSSNPQTTIASLRLMTVLIHKNHNYVVDSIIKTEPVSSSKPQRTHGALNAEIRAYLAVAEEIGGEAGMDEAYENHVKDAQRAVEMHCCSNPLLTLESLGIPTTPNPMKPHPSSAPKLQPHTLQHDDRFITQLLVLLSTFLTNNIELNLTLTSTILTLASCPLLRLEDWLAVNPHLYRYEDTHTATQDDALSRLHHARREPNWSSHPLLLQSLHTLSSQLTLLKRTNPSLAQLINTRKQAFRLHDEISHAIISPAPSTSSRFASPIPNRPNLSSRLFTRSRNASPAAPSTPRGRSDMRDLTPTNSASPARTPVVVGQGAEDLLSDIVEGANSELLGTKVRVPQEGGAEDEGEEVKEVSLSHVLTNVVVLQEFVLELVAVMQVRASLFGEVVFA